MGRRRRRRRRRGERQRDGPGQCRAHPQRAAALCRPRHAPEIAPLPSPPQLEAVFLSLINYSTVIGRKQFAKYYYALLDVAPPSPGAPTCSFKRRAAATLGYGP